MEECPKCEERKLHSLKKLELKRGLIGYLGGITENRAEYVKQLRFLSGLKKDGLIYLIQRISKIKEETVLLSYHRSEMAKLQA